MQLLGGVHVHVLAHFGTRADEASIAYRNENELLATAADPERFYIETVMPDKLRINLQYVQNHSLWGDIKLIFKTFVAVLH